MSQFDNNAEEMKKLMKEYQDMVSSLSKDDATLVFLICSLASTMHQQGQSWILQDRETLEGLRTMQETLLQDIFKRYSLLLWDDIKETVLKACGSIDMRKMPVGEKRTWGTYKKDSP